LPDIPLWGEYSDKWGRDFFVKGPFEKKAVYGPFRIIITLLEISALGYVIQAFFSQEPKLTASMLIGCLIVWAASVVVQILIIHSILDKIGIKLERPEKEDTEFAAKRAINWSPRTWVNILKLFLVMDIIFPE
jgi:hypothetical protein